MIQLSAVIKPLLHFHISLLQALCLALLCARPKQSSQALFVFAVVSFSVVLTFSFCSGFWLPIRIPPVAQPVLELYWKWPRSGEAEGSLTVRTEFYQSNIKKKKKKNILHGLNTCSLQPQQIFRLIICWNCRFLLRSSIWCVCKSRLKKKKIGALGSSLLLRASMYIIADMKRNVPYSLFSTH